MPPEQPRHTPGPWTTRTDGSGLPDSMKKHPDTGEPYRETCGIEAKRPDGTTVAVAHVYTGPRDRDFTAGLAEQTANARLIATAPRLLVALTDAYHLLSHSENCASRFHKAAECTCEVFEIGQVLIEAGGAV